MSPTQKESEPSLPGPQPLFSLAPAALHGLPEPATAPNAPGPKDHKNVVYIYIYIYFFLFICLFICLFIYSFMYVQMYTYIYMYIQIYTYTHIIYTYHIYICLYIYYSHMHVYIYINYTHVYIYSVYTVHRTWNAKGLIKPLQG